VGARSTCQHRARDPRAVWRVASGSPTTKATAVTVDVPSVTRELARTWCEVSQVTELRDGTISVSTPFLMDDGDAFPVVIRRRDGGWVLTDDGRTRFSFVADEFSVTEAREAHISRLAEAAGFSYSDHLLSRFHERPPTAFDVADLIVLVSQVRSIPLAEPPRDSEEIFRTRARRRTMEFLAHPESAVADWRPRVRRGEVFRADLWIPTVDEHPPVVTFYAATPDKADRSISLVLQYARWELSVTPILVHPGNLRSDVIYRAQTAIGDDRAVVTVDETTTLGYAPLRRQLAGAGVELVQ
jgi:hypothetical protein